MSPPIAARVSQRSRLLVSKATGNAERTRTPPTRRIHPLPKRTAAAPPSEVADKDDTVQNWLDRQPSSPSSLPSIAQGIIPESRAKPPGTQRPQAQVRGRPDSPEIRRQERTENLKSPPNQRTGPRPNNRSQPEKSQGVKKLFSSPSKSRSQSSLPKHPSQESKKVPFKRGSIQPGRSEAPGTIRSQPQVNGNDSPQIQREELTENPKPRSPPTERTGPRLNNRSQPESRQGVKKLFSSPSKPRSQSPPPKHPNHESQKVPFMRGFIPQGRSGAPGSKRPQPQANGNDSPELQRQELTENPKPQGNQRPESTGTKRLQCTVNHKSKTPPNHQTGLQVNDKLLQQKRSGVNKRLFTSPSKTRSQSPPPKRSKQECKKVPFKRGRSSGGSSIPTPANSPGTNWRKKQFQTIVRTTISPGKIQENGSDQMNSNILIEVSTPSEKSPGKWNVVSYQNDLGSPASSGTWLIEDDEDVSNEHFVQDDDDNLGDVLDSDNSPKPVATNSRKRPANFQRTERSPKVRMVCRDDLSAEFFVESDDELGPELHDEEEHQTENENQTEELASDNLQPNSKRKRTDRPRANTRKRLTNKSQWKQEIARKGYNDGSEYVTSRGTIKKAREIKPACSNNCNRCTRVLLPEERYDIFETFWALSDIQKKRDFISRLIDEHVPDTCSTSPECAKKSIRRYHFVVEDEEVKVCKKMFCNTLGIPDAWIETTLKKLTATGLEADARGKHDNRPTRIPEDTLQSMRDHINLFPRVYSHYTRERSKREYLETHVHSIERMYKLYKEWALEKNVQKVGSLSAYRKIFNTEFNLGFFLPRKDQCETCAKWKICTPDERKEMVQAYAQHLANKRKVKKLKLEDIATASELKCVACFDLQKVLICPRSEVSLFFYHQKISMYNFTVFDLRLSEGHNYLWTEVDAAKGSNEVGTNLLSFIETKIDEGVKEFVLYSDSPSGQNRNRMVFSMYLHASLKYNIKITHRFLESGHSYSEADSMHGLIENEARIKQEIYTPAEWETLIRTAKQDGKPYIVNHLKNEDVLNLHALVDKETWEIDTCKQKVFWSKVKEVAVDGNTPNCIFYRYNFSDTPSKIEVKLKRGSTIDHKTYKYPPAFQARIPLPEKKKKDLRKLMERGALPSSYHPTFERYLSV